MTFALFGEEGYRRDIASVNGWYELVKFCVTNGGIALRNFVETGETEIIDQVNKDIDTVMPKCSDPDVKSTLEGLRRGLDGVKEIAIISDY